MSEHNDPQHDETLERAFDALRNALVPDGPPESLIADTVAALEAEDASCKDDAARETRPHTLFARIREMKRTTKWTAAAAVCLLIIAGVFPFTQPPERALAFEDVARAIENIESATYRLRAPNSEFEGGYRVMYLAPSRERMEYEIDGVTYVKVQDVRKRIRLNYGSDERVATITEGGKSDFAFEGLEKLREMFREAQADGGRNVKPLGMMHIGDTKVQGFQVDRGLGLYTEVWADCSTGLPVLAEVIGVGDEGMISASTRTLITDFQYNIPLDESLFSLTPPEAYEVKRYAIDTAPEGYEDPPPYLVEGDVAPPVLELSLRDAAIYFGDVRSGSCEVEIICLDTDKRILKGKCSFKGDRFERTDMTFIDTDTSAPRLRNQSDAMIVNYETDRILKLNHEEKSAQISTWDDMSRMPSQFAQLRDWLKQAESGDAEKVQVLGDAVFDERRVQGFSMEPSPQPHNVTKRIEIWADSVTGLPMSVNMWADLPTPSLTFFHNFKYNIPLDDAIFSMEIPEGYSEIDWSKPDDVDQ